MLKTYEVLISTEGQERSTVVRARHPEEAMEEALRDLRITHEEWLLAAIHELDGGAYVN